MPNTSRLRTACDDEGQAAEREITAEPMSLPLMKGISMWFFLSACGLGFAFCALPGAVTTQAVRRGLEHGFLSALSLQLGALLGVALWAIVAFMGIAVLVQRPLARLTLGGAGVLILFWLTWRALNAAAHGTTTEEATPDEAKAERPAKLVRSRRDVAVGAALSLANPGAIAFWLGIGSTAMTPAQAAPNGIDLTVFLVGLLSGALLWCFLLSGLLGWGRRFVTPLFFRVVNLVCGLALGVFALKLLWSTILLVNAR